MKQGAVLLLALPVFLALGASARGVSPCPAPQGAGPAPSPAIEREWLTRRWALDGARGRFEAGAELASALASTSWQERHLALDALARMPFAEPWLLELAQPLVDDVHPNVRAAAVAALANALPRALPEREGADYPAGALIPAHRLRTLAADRLPDVRRNLARFLGRLAEEPGVTHARALLLALTADSDTAVEVVARRELLALGPWAEAEQGALFEALMESGAGGPSRHVDVTEALLVLARAPGVSAELLGSLERLIGPPDPSSSWLSLRAEVEALRWIHHGEGSAEALAAGWLAGETRPHRSLVRGLLVWGARAAGEPFARALLKRAADPGSVAPEELAGTATEDALSLWIDGALEAVLPSTAAGLALSPEILPGLTPAACSALWDRAGVAASSWERRDVEPWLAHVAGSPDGDPDPWVDTRLAILNALAGPLVREGDNVSGDLLAGLLEDPEQQVAEAAFFALCDAPQVEAWYEDMYRFWARRDHLIQLILLERVPRRTAAGPFRDGLLALGAVPATRTVSVVELLGRSAGDADVALALDAWLEESLLLMEGARDAAAFRRAEGRARGALRALLAVTGSSVDGRTVDAGIVERVLAVLGRTQFLVPPDAGLGPAPDSSPDLELPKACVAGLGRSPAGMDALNRLLAPDGGRSMPRRVRVEAEIILASAGRLAGLGSLAEDYFSCDGDLRLRMLRALAAGSDVDGGPGGAGAGEFLLSVAGGAALPVEQRVVALESLRRRAGPGGAARVRGELLEFLRGERVLDLRRVALAQLEHVDGGDLAIRAFGEVLDARLRARPGEPEREALEILWGEVLVAEARVDGLVGRDARCLSRPMASAARDLAARFRGESLAGTAFTWRSELEAARELAGLGRLALALAEEGDPWSRMDGRLLFALAEEALGGPGEESGVAADPESAALLFQGARVALAGEGPGDRTVRQRYEGRALATLARIHLLELARAAGRWEQAERLATELLRDWRRGNLHRLAFEGRLGVYDPARGVDPARRLGDIAAEARARVDGGRPVAPSPDGRER